MAKGIPSSSPKAVIERIGKNLVGPSSKYLPCSETAECPAGIPIPDGIRIRTGRGVELRFYYNGERLSETVRGRPTVAFVMEVARKRERIEQLIGLGKFSEADYKEEFPDSPRFSQEIETEPVMTVGQALDEWLLSREGTVGQNSKRDYALAIKNQLKPFKFPDGHLADSEFVRFPTTPLENSSLILARHLGGPARNVNIHDHCVLGQLPITRLTDVLINVMRTTMQNDGLGIKRINNMTCPFRGAISRQFMLKKLPLNPFDLIQPLLDHAAPLVTNNHRSEDDALDAPLPGDDISGFINEEGAPDPFSIDEMGKILSQLDVAMANQFNFSFWSGLRTGETIALRASDLQLDQNRILVRRSLSRGVLKTTKTDKQRWLYLLPPAKRAIEAQLALFNAPGGWVFPNPFTKQRWKNDSKITKRWTNALARAGVRYRRPYQTRHTYASMMLSAGENIMYVAQQMGHADWSMLVKVYGQWLPSGATKSAGSLVADAQSENWSRLLTLLQTCPVETQDGLNDSEDEAVTEEEPVVVEEEEDI